MAPPTVRFGVFDHLDRSGPDLARQYEERLELVEAYDRAGLYAYHVAEHHGTPLGLAPAPSVFLAAVTQRTRTLRLGPLVYALSLYHPLRLLEEVCMLDALSGGRLELGVGRGISPIELAFLGVEAGEARGRYEEALEVLLRGMAADRLTFEGEHWTLRDVPIELAPVQRPHPPLWYGVGTVETAERVAGQGMNIVSTLPAAAVRAITGAYRAAWARRGRAPDELPLLGMSRHIVVADDDGEALALLRGAYADWFASLEHLWVAHGTRLPLGLPREADGALAAGIAVAGSPATVRDRLLRDVADAGVTYVLCRFAFGRLALEASLRSVTLFEREVAPAFATSPTYL